jgi:hypothetical protein
VALFTTVDRVDHFRRTWAHGDAFAADGQAAVSQVAGEDLFPHLAADANAGYDGVVLNCFSGRGLMTVFGRGFVAQVAQAP